MKQVFTFWEGPMPAYIRLCMETWKVPYTVLNYDNVLDYTEFDLESAKRFSLAQIADCVRVHVLRDNGGYWLDADTIMVTKRLPRAAMIGDNETRINTCGYLYADPRPEMFKEWAEYQDKVLADPDAPKHWAVMANAFSDRYAREHIDMKIAPVGRCWPETYMISEDIPRMLKYRRFYFQSNFKLEDILKTDMLMLHNSWTPKGYKYMPAKEILAKDITLSNILRELL